MLKLGWPTYWKSALVILKTSIGILTNNTCSKPILRFLVSKYLASDQTVNHGILKHLFGQLTGISNFLKKLGPSPICSGIESS